MQVKFIDATESFAKLEHDWNRLFEEVNCESPFLSWEWMYEWWRHYHPKLCEARLALFTVRNSKGKLEAVLPLFSHLKRMLPGIKTRHLQFLGTEFESSDYLDLLCKDSDAEHLVHTIFESESFKRLVRSGIDSITFSNVLPSASIYQNAAPLANELLTKASFKRTSVCPYLTLPPDEKILLSALSKNFKSNIKRARNKLNRAQSIRIERIQSNNRMDPYIEYLFELHDQRFIDKNQDTKFNYERRGAFHKVIANIFSHKGWLNFYVIYDAEKPIGALYCYRLHNHMMYVQSGFDPSYHKWSLGNQILFRAITDSISEGLKIFDFMRGGEAYKYKWTSEVQYLYRISLPLSNRSKWNHRAQSFIDGSKSAIKTLIRKQT